MDIIAQGEQGNIHALGNGMNVDAYFLTMLGLNGVCTEWCSEGMQKI